MSTKESIRDIEARFEMDDGFVWTREYCGHPEAVCVWLEIHHFPVHGEDKLREQLRQDFVDVGEAEIRRTKDIRRVTWKVIREREWEEPKAA